MAKYKAGKKNTVWRLILLVIVGFLFVSYLIWQGFGLFSKASPSTTPKDVRITNISDNSFTVTWITPDKNTTGAVQFGENVSLGKVAFDDRDNKATKGRLTHHVTLNNLKPQTAYFYKIISDSDSYDNNGAPYEQKTAPTTDSTPSLPEPVFGTLKTKDGKTPEEALVYINVDKGSPLSSYLKDNGSWLVTLNNARTENLSDYVKVNDNSYIDLNVQTGKGEPFSTLIVAKQRSNPFPIVLSPSEAKKNNADFNNDNIVNGADLSILRNHIGETGTNLQWDLNKDGTVNTIDFLNALKQLF